MKPFAMGALLLIIGFALTSCNNAGTDSSNTTPLAGASRYHLKGKVVSIDEPGKMAIIDAEAIPDFMGAMSMPYKIKPESDLQKLKPGEAIAADVVVQGDNYWLENIAITNPDENKK